MKLKQTYEINYFKTRDYSFSNVRLFLIRWMSALKCFACLLISQMSQILFLIHVAEVGWWGRQIMLLTPTRGCISPPWLALMGRNFMVGVFKSIKSFTSIFK